MNIIYKQKIKIKVYRIQVANRTMLRWNGIILNIFF